MNDAAIRLGILKCRDLVELYYGVRLVAFSRITIVDPSAQLQDLLTQDPRRIAYTIVITSPPSSGGCSFNVGTPLDFSNGMSLVINQPDGGSYTIDRNFLTDLDTVTEAIQFIGQGGAPEISVREVFLTPLPADES